MFGIADVYAIMFVIMIVLLSFPGLIVLLQFGLPRRVALAGQWLERKPGRAFFMGLPFAAGFGLFSVALTGSGGPAAMVGITLGVIMTAISLVGTASLARLLGGHLWGEPGSHSQLKRTGSAALVIGLASLFPIVGWFLVFPFLYTASLGGALLALLGRVPRVESLTVHEGETVIMPPIVREG